MVGVLVDGTLAMLAKGVTNYRMKLFNSWISAFSLNLESFSSSNYSLVTSVVVFQRPTLVSCWASPKCIDWISKSVVVKSSSLTSFIGLSISIVRCPILGSLPRVDKFLALFTLVRDFPNWMARDMAYLSRIPSSLLFLFRSNVDSNHESMPNTLLVVPSISTLNILFLEGVKALEEGKGFWERGEISVEPSLLLTTSITLVEASF